MAAPLISEGSRILNRSFALPVSPRTCGNRIFCSAFQWGRFLNSCSLAQVRYGHHQHLAAGRFPVPLRILGSAAPAMPCLQLAAWLTWLVWSVASLVAFDAGGAGICPQCLSFCQAFFYPLALGDLPLPMGKRPRR